MVGVTGEATRGDANVADAISESATSVALFFSHVPRGSKKVLFVTTVSGFLPQFERSDVDIMRKMGYELHYASNFNNPVYTISDGFFETNEIVCHHIDIAKRPFHFATNSKSVIKLLKIINKEHIDIVHCHNPVGGVVARIAAQLSKEKPYVIYTAHGLHFYKDAPLLNWLFFYPVEKFLARLTDEIVTINKEDYAFIKSHFRLKPNGKADLIHGVGINMNKFDERPELAEDKRRELGIPQEAFHIVTAAELNDNKNQKTVIDAISKIDSDKIYYSLCGKGPKGDFLKQFIADRKLSGRVRLLGFRTDMEEVLQTADAFVFPSIREGLGVAAVEALSCGVPLIVADNRGTREYAINGKNSIVCKAKDSEEFKIAIEKLMSDKSLYSVLKSNCRKSAEKFSTECTADIMRMVYARADKYVRER